ncbi:MAG: M28 family peptidase [bacterium]
MKFRPSLVAALGLIACTAAPAPSPQFVTSAAISEADLRHRLFLIADDSMMGRESGSEGNSKTAAYVATEFKRLGLEPAGENGTYFQTVPFWNAAVDPQSQIEVGGKPLQLGRDFVPANIAAGARTFDGVRAIYGGPVTDTSRWISPADAAGKIVVLDLPPGIPMRGLALGGPRWRDASAIFAVVLDVVGAETVARLREGRPVADTARNRNAIPTLWITRSAARTILGADPATLAPGALSAPVRGRFDIARTPVAFPARNVVAILRGSDPMLRGQYVSLTAHNDHVGFDRSPVDHDSLRAFNRVIRPMGADSPVRPPSAAEWAHIRTILDSLRRVNRPRLDSIRNGADDDGSGTVALLEIAEAMSRGARPRRSILFVNHTGEEAGLLGSRWYSDHPTVPLDSIVGEIDQDMTGRGTANDFPRGGTGAGSPTYLEVIGAKRLSKEFGDSLEAANSREPVPFVFDYTFDAPGHPLQYYCRADHYSYARYGIPSVAMSRGEHLDYHQVTDEPQYISYPDLARVTRMVYSAASVIANMPHRPKLDVPKPADPHGQCRQ